MAHSCTVWVKHDLDRCLEVASCLSNPRVSSRVDAVLGLPCIGSTIFRFVGPSELSRLSALLCKWSEAWMRSWNAVLSGDFCCIRPLCMPNCGVKRRRLPSEVNTELVLRLPAEWKGCMLALYQFQTITDIQGIWKRSCVLYSSIQIHVASVARLLRGFYYEVLVTNNPDCLSLALSECCEGICMGSISFAPEVGAVIAETRVFDATMSALSSVTSSYTRPLVSSHAILEGEVDDTAHFKGKLSLFVNSDGKIAFFRSRCTSTGSKRLRYSRWESTGYVSTLNWCRGGIVRPCLAFRDPGPYSVRVSRVLFTSEQWNGTSGNSLPSGVVNSLTLRSSECLTDPSKWKPYSSRPA